MNYKFNIIIFYAIVSSIQAKDVRDVYTVDSVAAHNILTNLEEAQINKIGGEQDLVSIQVYYESFCPFSIDFITTQLKQTVEKLAQFLTVKLYPYGNANTTKVDGNYVFSCQHGTLECYGNMLHACAIDQLNNITQAVLYNACLMDPQRSDSGSDDAAADECGKIMNIDSAPIKACAKGNIGPCLHNLMGVVSSKVHYPGVPYILINDEEFDDDKDLIKKVCADFKNPPPLCSK